MVVKGQSASRTIALAVASAAGIPVAELWPGKYPDLEKLDLMTRGRALIAKQVEAERAAYAAKASSKKPLAKPLDAEREVPLAHRMPANPTTRKKAA